ncbi:unnamed protein product [Meganyctiphanes norvegica]|uniref:Uncharacterized protein n=1 Tax=Meganyctiphanes norvegica TaxID=48144 RepID=A0AAV2PM88_MEGNR
MSHQSKSQTFREEGNKLYRTTQIDGLPPVILRGRLEKTMICYRHALDWSVNSMEKSSSLKNIALTSIKLFKVLLNMGERKSTTEYYLNDGIQSFDLALDHGLSGGQEQQWSNDVCERYMESIDSLFHHLVTKNTKDQIQMLEEIASKLKNEQAKSRILRETARISSGLPLEPQVDTGPSLSPGEASPIYKEPQLKEV